MSKKEQEQEKEAGSKQQEELASDFLKGGWTEQSDGEVVKLEIGEIIEGLLIDKSTSSKYNDCGIYKLQVNNDSIPKVILGSRQLDRLMAPIEIGKQVKILFLGKEPTDKGQSMNVYKVASKTE